jgi:hypothetical protein
MANQAAKISSGITQTQFNSYVGDVGRLFYNLTTGELRRSDGVTAGGVPVYVAMSSANIGNLLITNTTISTISANANINLSTTGVGGSINVQGELVVYQGSNLANVIIESTNSGTLNFYTPNQNSLDSAIDIIGTPTGEVVRPIQTGVMLQITGQPSLVSRLYNDGINNYALFVGRRVNGTAASPTAVQAGDDIVRYGANPYNSAGTFPATGVARMVMTATENQTSTNQGSNVSIWTTAIGTAVIQNTATFDSTGLTLSSGRTLATPRVVFNDGGVRSISGGTAATVDFSTDSMILWYVPSGTATVTLANYTAGAVVRLHIRLGATSRDINYGVALGDNSSTAATSFNGSGGGSTDISNSTMQLVYTCYDGTAANTYVSVTTI